MTTQVPLQIPRGIPKILPADVQPFAIKKRDGSKAEREPAREKRGMVGWMEFGNDGVSYPYRRRHNKWCFDGQLARFPGGIQKKTPKQVSV